MSEASDIEQKRLDERCVRFLHHERSVTHCANPRCPALHPALWTAFLEMAAIRHHVEPDRPEDDEENEE